ncbi:hypothetical protein ACFPRL_02340 [Pseudoclavibacter helvolus]
MTPKCDAAVSTGTASSCWRRYGTSDTSSARRSAETNALMRCAPRARPRLWSAAR